MIISVLNQSADGAKDDGKKVNTIVRMDRETQTLAIKSKNRKKAIIQALQISSSWREVRDQPNFPDQLKNFEEKELQMLRRYKFAVIYCKEGQSENEMFANSKLFLQKLQKHFLRANFSFSPSTLFFSRR
jgi:hypothetical protein